MSYWLFKTEPDEFGIQDLEQAKNKRENWNGVRNYQARNFLRDQVALDDLVFIYHSSCKLVGIAGLAKISQISLVDPSQFDPQSTYYDPKSTPDKPRWFMVEVEHVETFEHVLALKEIKRMPDILHNGLVQKGHRLSIMQVQEGEFALLLYRARQA